MLEKAMHKSLKKICETDSLIMAAFDGTLLSNLFPEGERTPSRRVASKNPRAQMMRTLAMGSKANLREAVIEVLPMIASKENALCRTPAAKLFKAKRTN